MKAFILLLFVILPIGGGALSTLSGGDFITGMIPGLIADFFLFMFGVRIVKQKTVKIVEFLGKYNRIIRPGLSIIIPLLEWTKTQVLYKRNFQVAVDGLTKDNVTVQIGLNVIFYVKDEDNAIIQSIYEIDYPEKMIRATIDEQLRAMITNFTHKDIFTKRQDIGDTIEENLRVKLQQFGFSLDSIQVQDIKLEGKVLQALNRIVETEKLKEAAFNEGEATRIKMVKEAEADKEAKKLIGEGMAEQRKAISAGFKESVEAIKATDKSLTGHNILEFLLDSARIETLEKVGDKNAKVIYLNENLEANNKRVEKFLADK